MLLDRSVMINSLVSSQRWLSPPRDPAEDTVWIRHVPWAASYRSAEE